jgi:hypothetical protein
VKLTATDLNEPMFRDPLAEEPDAAL